jgi:phospho-N-acetylmuramoyl-pentapeptide-transferase
VNIKNDLILFLAAFVLAFIMALVSVPLLKKLRAGQSILKYVDMHTSKSGTPTMGGIIFILPVIIISCFFLKTDTPLSIIIIASSAGYALVGFLDDYLKIRGHQNLGLRPYQKIIGQGGVALLVSYFFMTANPAGQIFVPFFNVFINIGAAGIFVFTFFVLVATTNAVNLTDGVDGLAGSVTLVYFVFIYALIAIMGAAAEIDIMGKIIAVMSGALLAFLLFNTKKAAVFMGDTGSLFLGSMLATVSVFSYLGLAILILGVMFVWSAVTVIIQVAYFKMTNGKRVFLMTPYHHHLEKRGFPEPKIVAVYVTITIVAGVLLIITAA